MIEKRFFDIDPLTGATRWFYYDHATDESHIETELDAEPILEANKFCANEDNGKMGELQRIASIPMNLYFDLKEKGIIGDPKRLRAFLNDPDNRFFRTRLGRV